MQSIQKTIKEKCKRVNGKRLALKYTPYVIFGYVFNKVSWLYGQQAGDNTLQKVLDTLNGMGVCKSVSKFYAEGFNGWHGMRDRISYGSIL